VRTELRDVVMLPEVVESEPEAIIIVYFLLIRIGLIQSWILYCTVVSTVLYIQIHSMMPEISAFALSRTFGGHLRTCVFSNDAWITHQATKLSLPLFFSYALDIKKRSRRHSTFINTARHNASLNQPSNYII
jgi:hypothetical protein